MYQILHDQPDSTRIERLYHISDLHIRNVHRHDEYRTVFRRMYRVLSKEIGDQKDALIVITGDVMNTKTAMSPESFSIAQDLFSALAKIAPVILIAGNHDCNLSNKNRMDALTPVVQNLSTTAPVHYLRGSGFYRYQNVVFGVSSIFAKSALLADQFPEEMSRKSDRMVALYHGPVHQSITDVGYRMNNSQYTAETFAGYHYALLGDVHRYQYLNEERTIAYAGSLIQQSHGEKLTDHGILRWHLSTGASKHLPVKNDYGYVTIQICEGKLPKLPALPKNLCIRWVLDRTSPEQQQACLEQLQEDHHILEEIVDQQEHSVHGELMSEVIDPEDPKQLRLQTDNLVDNQIQYLERYLEGSEPEHIEQMVQLHQKVHQQEVSSHEETMGNSKWNILRLEFSYLFSYGPDNVIDFREMDRGQIVGIVAPNQHGKSALLDTILFCLFDKNNRGERKSVMNHGSDWLECQLLFEIGEQQYLITRTGKRTPKSVKIDVDLCQMHWDANAKKWTKQSCNGLDRNDTNKKIEQLVGTIQDYLATSFWMGGDHGASFAEMTQAGKKEYLSRILRLDSFPACHDYAKNRGKELEVMIKSLQKQVTPDALSKAKADHRMKRQERAHLDLDLVNLTRKIDLYALMEPYGKNISSGETAKQYCSELQELQDAFIAHEHAALDQAQQQMHLAESECEERKSCVHDHTSTDHLEQWARSRAELVTQLVELPDHLALVPWDQFDQTATFLAQAEQLALSDRTDAIATTIAEIAYLEEQIHHSAPWLEIAATDRSSVLENRWQEWSPLAGALLAYHPSQNREALLAWHSGDPWRAKVDQLLSEIQARLPKEGCQSVRDLIDRWYQEQQAEEDRISTIPDDGGRSLLDQAITECRAFQKSAVEQTDYYLAALHRTQSQTNQTALLLLRERLQELEREQEAWLQYRKLAQVYQLMEPHVAHYRGNLEIRKKLAAIDAQMSQHSLTTSRLQSMERAAIRKRDLLREEIQSVLDRARNRDLEQLQIERCHTQLVGAIWRDTAYHHYQEWNKEHRTLIANRVTLETDRIHLEIQIQQLADQIDRLVQIQEHIAKYQAKAEKYLAYQKLTHPSGLPYYMMKHYLPLIEAEINRSLHHMVSFDVLFSFVGDGRETDPRAVANRTARNNSVDVQIRHANGVVLDVRSGSGLEKFAVSFAIRITLQRISRMPRANFFVMDEVWGSIDSDNMTRLDQMLRPLCAQIDYLLVISQSDDLRQLVDRVILVNKENEKSSVRFESGA